MKGRIAMRWNDKLYYVSGKEMRLVEVKRFRMKFFALLTLSVLVSLSIITAVNHLFGDVLSLGYDRVQSLQSENEVLQNHLKMLNGKVKTLQAAIDRLARQDNNLRLLVDLPPIDEDVRNVGTGGRVAHAEVGIGNAEVANLLNRIMTSVDKLEREVKLEEESYDAIVRKYESNKVYFQHLPAIKPMEGYYDPESFGMRIHPVLHIRRMHEGIDILNDVGTPVVATGDGVVEFAGHSAGGYGIVVEINHGYGYRTIYAHLSTVLVHVGMKVKRGQVIARSGRTGLVSGPHLHYEVIKDGVKQNPVDYFFDDVRFSMRGVAVGD